jgi:hypothetical protein
MVAIAGSYMSQQVLNSFCLWFRFLCSFVYMCYEPMFAGIRSFIQFGRDSTRETWAGPNSRSLRDLVDRTCRCDCFFFFISVTNASFFLSFCDECHILFFFLWWMLELSPRIPAYGVGPECWGGAAEFFWDLNLIRELCERESFPCAKFLELGLGSEYGRYESTGEHGLALVPSRIMFSNSTVPVDIQ